MTFNKDVLLLTRGTGAHTQPSGTRGAQSEDETPVPSFMQGGYYMELNEIFKLIDAGYTKEDIEKMSATPEAKVEEKPETKPEAKPEVKSEAKSEAKADTVDLEVYVKELNDRLGKLVDTVGAMQADNISKADAGEPTPKPTFEELVANFTKDM